MSNPLFLTALFNMENFVLPWCEEVKIESFFHSSIHSFIHSFIYLFIHSFIHLFIRPFSHSFNSILHSRQYVGLHVILWLDRLDLHFSIEVIKLDRLRIEDDTLHCVLGTASKLIPHNNNTVSMQNGIKGTVQFNVTLMRQEIALLLSIWLHWPSKYLIKAGSLELP